MIIEEQSSDLNIMLLLTKGGFLGLAHMAALLAQYSGHFYIRPRTLNSQLSVLWTPIDIWASSYAFGSLSRKHCVLRAVLTLNALCSLHTLVQSMRYDQDESAAISDIFLMLFEPILLLFQLHVAARINRAVTDCEAVPSFSLPVCSEDAARRAESVRGRC